MMEDFLSQQETGDVLTLGASQEKLSMDMGMDMNMTMIMIMRMTFYDDYKVSYLFESWEVDTKGKYACAVIGTFLAGMFLEFLIFTKSFYIAKNKDKTLISKLVKTFLQGIILTLSYLLMLVVMTYNTGLFLSLIFGITLGHFLFQQIGGDYIKQACCSSPQCVNTSREMKQPLVNS